MAKFQSNELREERAALVEDIRKLANDGEITAESRQELDRMEVRFNELSGDIERADRVEGLTARTEVPKDMKMRSVVETLESADKPVFASDEYRADFDAFIRSKGFERRATMTIGVLADGGYTVPTTLHNEIMEALTDASAIRQVANVITTSNGNEIVLPRVTARGPASMIAEGVAYPNNNKTLDKANLVAYKYGDIMRASEELVQDSAFPIQSFIAQNLAMIIGERENVDLVGGDGSSKPEGVINATVGVTAAGTNTVAYGELVTLFTSVKQVYRKNAAWLVSSALFSKLVGLNDSTGRPLWLPGVAAGAPDTFMGRPIYVDSDMPAMTTGKVQAVFGDFKRGYWIRDVGQVAIQVLAEKYADTGEVGFKGFHRTDGALWDLSALRTLKTA